MQVSVLSAKPLLYHVPEIEPQEAVQVQCSLLPGLEVLGIAQQLQPQVDRILARIPAQEFLQRRQKQGHCEQRVGGKSYRTLFQNAATSTMTLQTATTTPMIAEDRSRAPSKSSGGSRHVTSTLTRLGLGPGRASQAVCMSAAGHQSFFRRSSGAGWPLRSL